MVSINHQHLDLVLLMALMVVPPETVVPLAE
jgi:hypothetical protein